MDKKIFFFDFDGTLRIEETDEITPHTYESFQKLKEKGYLLFLNTGRSYNALGPQVYTLPFDGFICGCGTFIQYHEEVLLEAKLEGKQMQEVLSCLEKYHVEAIFEGHRGLYCNEIKSEYMQNQVQSIRQRGLQFFKITDPTFHFVKMSIHYPNENSKIGFENEMSSYFDFIERNMDETEAILKGYSKGKAMRELLKHFEIAEENSYAFGDSNNDEEMLLAAGNSILIGQNAKHLIDQVDFVSKDASNDGVTYALYQLGVLKETMKNSPRIETNRFILRKFNDNDLQDLHEILKDETVNTYLPWFVSQTLEDTRAFLEERIYSQYEKGVSYFYAIESKKTHKVIGYADVTDIDLEEKCGDLGYGIHKDYWGQGIASEVSMAMLERLKEDGFAYIHATCDQKNIASGKVMQKCGMKYQYSYEEQWQPKDILVVFRMYQINLDGNNDRVFKKYWNLYPNHYIEEF